jgi:hypothetical protein
MDVKGAYLKSKIRPGEHDPIFLRLTDGRIVQLLRYLYGLKQSGAEWQKNVSAVLIKHGYTKSKEDPLCFFSRTQDGRYIFMVLHVDDFFVVASDDKLINNLHKQLIEEYQEVTVNVDNTLGYLGMQIKMNKDFSVTLTQPGYIQKLLDQFNPEKRIHLTPRSASTAHRKRDEEAFDKEEYLQLIGSLNYLAVYTRPDLLYAVSKAAQQCAHPTRGDYRRALRMIHYLEGSKGLGLHFTHGGEINLTCYVDAGFNQEPDAKSQYGFTFSLGENECSFYASSN